MDSLVRTFEKHVVRTDLGCWLWTGGVASMGYGQMRKDVRAHVWSHTHFNGPVPEGHLVRHICDNKLCVRPDHLTTGTQADNVHDMRYRFVSKHGGEGAAAAKLKRAEVLEIYRRGLAGEANRALADEFGVKPSTVYMIVTGRNWSWLTQHGQSGLQAEAA